MQELLGHRVIPVTWLLVEPDRDNQEVRNLLYRMWDGFIGLYDRLVFENEILYPNKLKGALETHLNFNEVTIPEYFNGNRNFSKS